MKGGFVSGNTGVLQRRRLHRFRLLQNQVDVSGRYRRMADFGGNN
jgi:hypothetical protein